MRQVVATLAVLLVGMTACTNSGEEDTLREQVASLQAQVQELQTANDSLQLAVDNATSTMKQGATCVQTFTDVTKSLNAVGQYLQSKLPQGEPTVPTLPKQCRGVLKTSQIAALNQKIRITNYDVDQAHLDRQPEKPTTTNPPPGCDRNYTGYCVPDVSYDLNCADIGYNTVYVVSGGYDKNGFDGDGDGIGCE